MTLARRIMIDVSLDFYLGVAAVGPIGIKHTISLCEIPVCEVWLSAFGPYSQIARVCVDLISREQRVSACSTDRVVKFTITSLHIVSYA
jgi:hypothetical protein